MTRSRGRHRIRCAVGLMLVLGVRERAAAESFIDQFGSRVTAPIGEALARSVGRGLPIPSASSGLRYELDLDSGALVPSTEVLGQLYLERPEPIGRHKLNLSLSYQYVEFDSLNGHDLQDLRDVGAPICGHFRCGDDPFVIPRFSIDLRTHEMIPSVTFGVTDDLEVNVTTPVLYSDFRLGIAFRDFDGHVVGAPPGGGTESGSRLGIGDVLLRGKYRLPVLGPLATAVGLVLRVPTGSEGDLQGTGTTELAPMLYAATPAWPAHGRFDVRPYVNAGVNFDADDVDQSEARYGAGLDVRVPDRVTGALAVLGRSAFARFAPAGAFDVARCTDTPARCGDATFARARHGHGPLFGIDGGRQDVVDLSIGVRVAIRQGLIAFANVLVPLNDAGLRSDAVPLVGIEAPLGGSHQTAMPR